MYVKPSGIYFARRKGLKHFAIMNKSSIIYIAGHNGLVGSAITRRLKSENYSNLIMCASSDLDLKKQADVKTFFKDNRPEYVFLAAAKVGGIYANNTYPADFIYDNLMIQTNIIHSSYLFGVKKLLFLGSSCIYPKNCPQPMKEEYLLSGYLETTNEPYAVAKIAGIKMCQAYNRQYGTNYISVMPTNLYGPGDNYDLHNSHVLPALIRKFSEAKAENIPFVEIWGTGTPRREFLYMDDLADACVFLMQNYNEGEIVNIGVGKDLTIKELAELIKKIAGYKGELRFDHTKPDGTLRKLLDVSKLTAMGWEAKTGLEEGISRTCISYEKI
uniref:GDP-L-fucose synthase n=2 Tax=Desulfobacterium TaxID=2295 RepID=E1YK67_9BACT|nr:Putative GDP-L-fucose synthase 2 [uncultured Desulfobacterium sp.]